MSDMPKAAAGAPLTPLAIVKAQRDTLAQSFHDLHIEHALLKQALADVSQKLAAAQARIAEMEHPPSAADDDGA